MNEDAESNQQEPQKSWLDRLSQALLREPQDRQQLVDLLRDAEERDLLDSESLTMIEGVLQVSIMRARDIMIPRGQMVVFEEHDQLQDILPVVIDAAHSRYPVITENKNEIIGVLLAKDLLSYQLDPDKSFKLSDVMRPATFVPESKRLDVLLREFRLTHNHMAIVLDEYGSIAGLVTIEDVLEQIVGEIEDEYDDAEEFNIKQHSEKEFIVKALTPIEDFNEFFKDHLQSEEYDTIGGLVVSQFSHLPATGEEASFGRYDFKVLNADKRRIHLLQVTLQ